MMLISLQGSRTLTGLIGMQLARNGAQKLAAYDRAREEG